MKGMILAAGLGTRFRPATYEVPKPMVPLCNRPLLDYAAEAMIGAGVLELIVNLHHLPDPIRDHMERHLGSRCKLQFSLEEEILGTGGGIRRVRSLLEQEEDFFLLNGDTIQFPSLPELKDSRRGENALAALLLREPPETDRFTRVFYENGRISGFGEGTGQTLMFAGAHCISRRIFDLLPDREFSGITEDVYLPAVRQKSDTLSGVRYDGPWFDIGTPSRYLSASESISSMMLGGELKPPTGSRAEQQRKSILSDTCRIEGDVERSVVGSRSIVHAGATVRRSVLWDEVSVRAGCEVTDAIIGNGVELQSGSQVQNAMVCRRLDVPYADGILLNNKFAFVPIDSSRPSIVE